MINFLEVNRIPEDPMERRANRIARLVPKCGSHRLRLLKLMARSSAWRWPWLGLHHHGVLRNLLQNIDPSGAAQLPRRRQS